MFLARGRVFKITDARHEALGEVLRHLMRLNSNFKVSFHDVTRGYLYELLMSKDTIVACACRDNIGNVFLGKECWDKVIKSNILDIDEGIIEIYELTESELAVNLSELPDSKLPEEYPITILPVTKPTRVPKVRREVISGGLSAPDDRFIRNFSLSKELEDPVHVSRILLSSSLLETSTLNSELIIDYLRMLNERYPNKTIYVLIKDDDVTSRILVNYSSRTISLYLLLGDREFMGFEALKELIKLRKQLRAYAFLVREEGH